MKDIDEIINKDEIFDEKYLIGDKLGSGHYATVYVCSFQEEYEDKIGDEEDLGFAVKQIDKNKLVDTIEKESVFTEISLLKEIDFEGIIKLYDVFETNTHWLLVTELAVGGELFDRIINKTQDDVFTEKEAVEIILQILKSLNYLHERNIVHRDLKPENILVTSHPDAKEIVVKLADFGLAAKCNEPLSNSCGSMIYIAPEVLRSKPYRTEPDMWSLGVLSYVILCGYAPFFSTELDDLTRKILKGKFKFDKDDWEGVSLEAKDFILRLITRNMKKRMTARQALDHDWIQRFKSELIETKKFSHSAKLREYQAKAKLHEAFMALRAIDNVFNLITEVADNHVVKDL